ncbi:cobaltochelatase subunit CobN [Devosia neptuniae]|uniref:Cobaltochelatase subunit CobN n=1 Tax=Devosia neptuniae TaxID=191302 RepID=A0ABY6CE42_9HYPH|nr:cobaltochelatase subunit CobN [Devosia neptuniae]UXN70504.1 cobaltochelatase subunit CobN [Devosia neptuniae]
MHLLSAQAGAIQQEGEAIDLNQRPGALIFASAADSELAMLAGAADRAGESELRLANTLRLSNNLSVDLWLEKTVGHARLVVLRLIGGAAYFQYGVDELTALCTNHKIPLALIPGDANPDPILQSRSTIHPDDWTRLHNLFIAGGPDNADTILKAFALLAAPLPSPLVGEGARRADEGAFLTALTPTPFARFGLWHPSLGITDESALRSIHAHPLGGPSPYQGEARRGYSDARPFIPILFYRAALEGAGTATITALIAELERQNLAPVPLLVSSLKEAPCVRFVQNALAAFPPATILNLTGFALGLDSLDAKSNPFSGTDAPVIQLIQSGRPEAQWLADSQGLSSKDLAMFLVMPEVDGRIGGLIIGHKADAVWHERCQVPLSAYAPDPSGITRAVTLAANWSHLRTTPRAHRKVAIVLANYPTRDGRLANGVGYDAPQSTVEILRALEGAGYTLSPLPSRESSAAQPLGEGAFPSDSAALITALQSGPTNANPARGTSPATLTLARYAELFATLPAKIQQEVTTRWGDPTTDPFVRDDTFHLPALIFGNVAILLQPARGYHLDETTSYHDPALVPPHAYIAAYLWLRHEFSAHALIHNGKHGTLEWLPGKATALDAASYPDALWGQLPHLYPFIVNDPGEGTQAKRRTGAVIIDHLVPPLTRAETYGPLKDLEALLDEYYAASGMDRRRLADLRRRILDFTRDSRLDRDIGLPEDETEALIKIDNFLCDLKEAQIRDGLHVFGQSPQGDLARDLTVALARVPRGDAPGDNSLIRALADDLKLGIDPLTARLGDPWHGPNVFAPYLALNANSPLALRHIGDVVEVLEIIAADLVEGKLIPAPDWHATRSVLATVTSLIQPRLAASGPAEMAALLDGLDGKFIAPGPSGAPSRGRLDVLPTGRNFYSVDSRAIPTPTAWELGKKSAESLVLRHFQDHGTYLQSLALSVWGTANMRTGGDDIAQALALIGAKPVWDPSSLRVSGYEIIPLARLGRPRIDVTLRISGFFRDAFPAQIALFDRAARAIGALDEPSEDNPIAARMRSDALGLIAQGQSEAGAGLAAGHRIFGSKPGSYGAGLNALVDSGTWSTRADLAKAALDWGQYAYGAQAAGIPERARFAARLASVDAIVHNQDNREHDLLDSDNYYQFEGGLSAAAEILSGHQPAAYHNDHSRPERPLIRTLEEEISHVMRSRVVNPKWIAGVKRHGYKGAFEIIATVDFMLAFAATTGAVKTHHFDLAFEAFVEDAATRQFILASNRYGYDELIAKFNEARRRGLWTPRSNSAYGLLAGEL